MTPCRIQQWVTSLILLTAAGVGEPRQQEQPSTYDFVCTRVLSDGVLERRIHKDDISAIETTVELAPNEQSQDNDLQILTVLQVTDGRHFIQLIYDSSWELRDCEYLKSAKSVDEFYEAFAADIDCPQQKLWNESRIVSLYDSIVRNNSLLRPDITDYASLRRECKTLHQRIREMALSQNGHHSLQRRQKRDGIFPGTYWCGAGSKARTYSELGYFAATDMCCREHDHCNCIIEAYSEKFNYYNNRRFTMSHCDCDEKFRTCLKQAGTLHAYKVGWLYFHFLRIKCFLLKQKKNCVDYWWRKDKKCLKYKKEITVVPRVLEFWF